MGAKLIREAYWVNETVFWRPAPDDRARIVRTGRVQDTEDGLSEFPHVIVNQARMNQVGKLDRILDEEHGDVVADQIPVAFVAVELDGEAAHIARRVLRALGTGDGREPAKHRRALALLRKHRRSRQLGDCARAFKISVRTRAPGMHDALGNALVIEMEDLLAEDEIFEERRTARSKAKAVLIVGYPRAVIGGEVRSRSGVSTDSLMRFPSAAM